jgi:hypothetical protein
MKKTFTYIYSFSLHCLILLVFIPLSSNAQNNGLPHDAALYKTIQHMDSLMFNAFNHHNIGTLGKLFASNVEFYHDKGGVQDYNAVMNGFKQVAVQNPDLHRELVAGTMEVYPIPGFGAIEMGEHRFIHTENGKEISAVFKFVHIWQFKDNAWQVTRVVSVGH